MTLVFRDQLDLRVMLGGTAALEFRGHLALLVQLVKEVPLDQQALPDSL